MFRSWQISISSKLLKKPSKLSQYVSILALPFFMLGLPVADSAINLKCLFLSGNDLLCLLPAIRPDWDYLIARAKSHQMTGVDALRVDRWLHSSVARYIRLTRWRHIK